MRTKMTTVCLAVAAAMTMAAAPASAAFVNTWNYKVTLEWLTGETTFTGTTGSQENNSTRLSWGSSSGNVDPEVNDERSGLEIGPDEATGSIDTGDSVTTVGITHFNSSIPASYDTLESAALRTNLILTPTEPAVTGGSELPPQTLEFRTSFIETTNVSPCDFDSNTICDDIFVVEFEALQDTFDLEGVTYLTSVVADGLGPLPADTCNKAGEDAGCFGLTTNENQFTDVNFGFGISAVPNPAMLALFGTGLMALGAVARRRNKI